jgi:hypothetical protein
VSETHTPAIRPATDEQIADYRTWNLNWLHHPKLAVSTVVSGLLSRIEAERAQNEELLAALEACLGIVTGEQMNKKALIDALEKSKAAIQKAKESR